MSKLNYNIDDVFGNSDIPEVVDVPEMADTPSFQDVGGDFQSGQYIGGEANFQNVNLGQKNITIDTTQNLQKAISALTATGGVINLKAGNYTITSDIAVPSAIRIRGENTSTTILTFVGAYGFTLTGTNIYTTGTVSINQGSTALTGSGTTWTSAMVGRQVFISNRWYVISAFISTTSLTLATAFADASVSGASYRITSVIKDVEFDEFTIQASSGTGISGTDVRDLYFEDIEILGCNKAFTFTNFMAVQMTRITAAGSTSNGYELTNGSFFNPIQVASVSNGGVGALLNNIKSCPWLFCANDANTGDGFDLTNVDQCLFSAECSGNGGYGIDISNSGCDNNIITSSIFSGNTSGTVNDSGTGTLIRGNVGIDDNYISSGGNFGDGSDGNVTISSNTSLTSDKYYNNLTVDATKTLNPNGYRIFVKGTLTLNGKIYRDGSLGGGSGLADGYLKGVPAPGAGGGSTENAAGSPGGAGTAVSNSLGSGGSAGQAGGDGNPPIGGRGGGAGGAASSATAANVKLIPNPFLLTFLLDISATGSPVKFTGAASAGGGGGGGDANAGDGIAGGGGGGRGGCAGGIVAIYAKNIIIGANGSITANGENGVDGGNGLVATNQDGNGGGGAGGNGGIIIICYNSLVNNGSSNITANAGTGGQGGGNGGTGKTAANSGSAGTIYYFQSSL